MGYKDDFCSELLPSGVQVVAQRMSGVESVAIGFLVGAGAGDEQPAEFGITHFVEQMLYRGTERHDARALSDRFDSLGISYDSSAGLEMTLLNAVLLGDKAPMALDLLGEVIRLPAFPKEAVDNVRALLLQELSQRDDQPAQKVMDLVRQQFYEGSPAGHDVMGTEETVTALSRDDLMRYWKDRYTANNMVVSIAGNFEWERTITQLRLATALWPQGSGRSVMPTPIPRSAVRVLREDKTQEHLGFAFPGVATADPRYYTTALLCYALGGGSTSRLFQEVREKRGLAYAAQARFDGLQSTGLVRIYVGTSAERAHESVEVVLEELHKLEAAGITEDELHLAKTRLKSQLIMRSESTSARMMANLRGWWFERRLRTLEEIRAEIDRVTVEDVSNLLAELNITHTLAAVALGPRPEKELFAGVLTRS
jgi:predicted Zn-dependent peptidase